MGNPQPDMQLPPGYRVLNDGPGREVLCPDDEEIGYVCRSVAEAVAYARWREGSANEKPLQTISKWLP